MCGRSWRKCLRNKKCRGRRKITKDGDCGELHGQVLNCSCGSDVIETRSESIVQRAERRVIWLCYRNWVEQLDLIQHNEPTKIYHGENRFFRKAFVGCKKMRTVMMDMKFDLLFKYVGLPHTWCIAIRFSTFTYAACLKRLLKDRGKKWWLSPKEERLWCEINIMWWIVSLGVQTRRRRGSWLITIIPAHIRNFFVWNVDVDTVFVDDDITEGDPLKLMLHNMWRHWNRRPPFEITCWSR